MLGFFSWFVLISFTCGAIMLARSVLAEVNEEKTLKDYRAVDIKEVPEMVQLLADRNKYDRSQFNIPEDINIPVTPKPYIPQKIVDGEIIYEFSGSMYVRQLQIIGDYAVKHDGNGNMVFYVKK